MLVRSEVFLNGKYQIGENLPWRSYIRTERIPKVW